MPNGSGVYHALAESSDEPAADICPDIRTFIAVMISV